MATIDDFAYGLGNAPEAYLEAASNPMGKTQAQIDAEDEAAAMARARKSSLLDLLPDAYVAGAVGAPRVPPAQSHADVAVNSSAPSPRPAPAVPPGQPQATNPTREHGDDFGKPPDPTKDIGAFISMMDRGGIAPPLDHLEPIQRAAIRYQRPGGEWQDFNPEESHGNVVMGGGVTSHSIYPDIARRDAMNEALAKDPFARERAIASTQFGNQIALLHEKAAIDAAVEEQRRQEFGRRAGAVDSWYQSQLRTLAANPQGLSETERHSRKNQIEEERDRQLEQIRQGFGFGERLSAAPIYKSGGL